MDALFREIDNLSLEKSKDCNLERFVRAFFERSDLIEKRLLPCLEREFDCNSFQSKVMLIHSRQWQIKVKSVQDTIIAKGNIPSVVAFYKPILDRALNQLAIKEFESLIRIIRQEFDNFEFLNLYSNEYKHIHGTEDRLYIVNNYVYFFIGRILYDNYKYLESKKNKYIV